MRKNFSQPVKKGETQTDVSVGDISSGSAIAVGRGWEANVVSQTAPPAANSAGPLEGAPTMADLDQIIDQSDLAAERKNATRDMLHTRFVPEIEKGEQADVLTVQQQLIEISNCLPELRTPLRLFIENLADVSVPVKIVARKLLA